MLTLLLACTGSQTDTDAAPIDAAPVDTAIDDTSALVCGTDSPAQQPLTVNGLSMNVACQGEGETLLLLHGFPEFWYAWTPVASTLAAGHRVVMPDQRGYNLTDKPGAVSDYQIDLLVADMVSLIGQLSDAPITVVAHDWGGVVAWHLAAKHPELLSRLIILNAPHPDVFARELAENPDQQAASTYMEWFQGDVEDALSADDFSLMGSFIFTEHFSQADQDAYIEAWEQPGALTAMLNWYRANSAEGGLAMGKEPLMVSVPTLVMWGMQDTALLAGNLDGLDAYVSDLTVIEYPSATHWIVHEEPAAVAADVLAFIGD